MENFIINFYEESYQYDTTVLDNIHLIDAEMTAIQRLQSAKRYRKSDYWAEALLNGKPVFRIKTEGSDILVTDMKNGINWRPLDLKEAYEKFSKYSATMQG
jgi:hypothetical protein